MRQVLDLDRWTLDGLDGAQGRGLVARCRSELDETGMFSLAALVRPEPPWPAWRSWSRSSTLTPSPSERYA